jgi:hypothetical protein
MDKKIIDYIDKEKLKNSIDELRDVLNKICVTVEDSDALKSRLAISQLMDQLIVKYMTQKDE